MNLGKADSNEMIYYDEDRGIVDGSNYVRPLNIRKNVFESLYIAKQI